MVQEIFTLSPDGTLTRMVPEPYKSEDDLQHLIAQYPGLLGVSDASDLLLIKREQAVPDSEESGGRWSIDHLFVDRNSVPVLVETKRASDTRIRREIVGQMLDYAANAAKYWPIETLQQSFLATSKANGEDASLRLASFLGDEEKVDAFWGQMEANIRSGRMRMLFVADDIPRELARVVEFLNEQMEAEVLAVEVKPYTGEGGLRTLVPRVIGDTERAAGQKSTGRVIPDPISRDEWLKKNILEYGEDTLQTFERAIELMESLGATVDVTSSQGSLYCRFTDDEGADVWPFNLVHNGTFQISFAYLLRRPSLRDESKRRHFYERFEQAVGPLSTKSLAGYPAFDINRLASYEVTESFMGVARDFVEAAVKTD